MTQVIQEKGFRYRVEEHGAIFIEVDYGTEGGMQMLFSNPPLRRGCVRVHRRSFTRDYCPGPGTLAYLLNLWFK